MGTSILLLGQDHLHRLCTRQLFANKNASKILIFRLTVLAEGFSDCVIRERFVWLNVYTNAGINLGCRELS